VGEGDQSKSLKRPTSMEKKLVEIKEKGGNPNEHKKMKLSHELEAFDNKPNQTRPSPPQGFGGYEKRPYSRRDEPVEANEDGDYYPTTIYVGEMDDTTTQADVENVFSKFGKIDCVRMVPGKNFCFVKYLTREVAQQAIAEMNGYILNGCRLRVYRAKVPSNKGRWGHAGGRDFHYRNDHETRSDSTDLRDPNVPLNSTTTTTTTTSTNLHKNIPYNLTSYLLPPKKEELAESQRRALRTYDDL